MNRAYILAIAIPVSLAAGMLLTGCTEAQRRTLLASNGRSSCYTIEQDGSTPKLYCDGVETDTIPADILVSGVNK